MKTAEVPVIPELAWFEPDPMAPVIGVKDGVMYRFSWERSVTSAGGVKFDLPRSGIVTHLMLELPVAAMRLDGFIRIRVNGSIDFLNAPLGLLPRKGRRVTLMDARSAPRVGINSEALTRLEVLLDVKHDCVVWLGIQRAHRLIP